MEFCLCLYHLELFGLEKIKKNSGQLKTKKKGFEFQFEMTKQANDTASVALPSFLKSFVI